MPLIGHASDGGKAVSLTSGARRQGVYLIGTTGTGKTTLLQNIAVEDMQSGEGLCVLDPHGDLIDELLARVPEGRREDVILLNPMDIERPFGLNLLECDRNDPHQVRWVVSTVMGTLQRLFWYSWGPRLEHVLRHSLLTTMALDQQATLVELLLLLTSDSYRERVVPKLTDYMLVNFWNEFPRSERLRYELTSSTLNKISPFLTDASMRNIVGQASNSFNMQQIMDEGKILLVNLSKGDLGEDNSALLGSVLVNLILIGALRRRSIPYEERRPFHLIVDEFQNFATESFAILQSEARKYAVDVIVAHQYRDQLDDLSKGSTLNVANFIVLRVSGKDSLDLASQFDNTPPPADIKMEPVYQNLDETPYFIPTELPSGVGRLHHEAEQPRRLYSDVEMEMANSLSTLPNFFARARLVGEDGLQEHSVKLINAIGKPNFDTATFIKEKSRQQYGRDRKEVEAEILERIGAAESKDPKFSSIFSE